jgi:hypothetical protein
VTSERRRPAAFSSGGADMDSPLRGRRANYTERAVSPQP